MVRLKYGIHDTLTFLDFPEYSPKRISTSNVLERLNKEFRRRSKSIGVFSNIQACLRLFTLYAIKYAGSWKESRKWKSGGLRRTSKQIHLHYHSCPPRPPALFLWDFYCAAESPSMAIHRRPASVLLAGRSCAHHDGLRPYAQYYTSILCKYSQV